MSGTVVQSSVPFLPPIGGSTQSSPRRMREEELLTLLDAHEERLAAKRRTEEEKEPLSYSAPPPLHSSLRPTSAELLEATALAETTAMTATLVSPASSVESSGVADLVAHLPSHLSFPFSSPECAQAVEWLWYLLHHHPSHASALLTSPPILHRLSSLLSHSLRLARGSSAKRRRNNLAALLLALAQHEDARPHLVHCGLLQPALRHATHLELAMEAMTPGRLLTPDADADDYDGEEEAEEEKETLRGDDTDRDTRDTDVRYTQSADAGDVELRRLLWALLATVSSHWQGLALLHQGRLLAALLPYVDASLPPRVGGRIDHWLHRRHPPSHLLHLQHAALVALRTVAPSLSQQFNALGGVDRLIAFVASIAAPSPLGQASRAQREELRGLAVGVVAAVLDASHGHLPHPDVDTILGAPLPCLPPPTDDGAQATVRVLLTLVADGGVALDCRAAALSALTSLGANSAGYRRVVREEGGVGLLAALLNDGAVVAGLVAHSPTLVAHAVSCVWRCVVGDADSEAEWLQARGVGALMDLVTRTAGDAELQELALGCLAELLHATPRSHRYLLEWSGATVLSTLRPHLPQSASLPLTTPSVSAASAEPPVSVLDVLLTLWPDEPLAPGHLPISRLLYLALSALGFDSSAFPSASPHQLADLAHISAFPFVLQQRQWSLATHRLQSDGLWGDLLPSDVARVEAAQDALELRLLACRRAQLRCLDAAQEAEEAGLQRFLQAVDERRVELDGRIARAASQQRQQARAAASAGEGVGRGLGGGGRSRTGSGGRGGGVLMSPKRAVTARSLPLPAAPVHSAALHNNSVYGRYKAVAVRVRGEAKEEGDGEQEMQLQRQGSKPSTGAQSVQSRPGTSSSLDSDLEPVG